MATLYRTTCSTDHKGRPNHKLEVVAESEDRQELLAAMDEDVREWQDADLRAYNEGMGEDRRTKWECEDSEDGISYFEMSTENDLREFVEKSEDGYLMTTCYHIL